MDILRRYWFWISAAAVLFVLLILRLVMVAPINGGIDTAVSGIEKSAKRISRKAQKASKLPNSVMLNQTKETIELLKGVDKELNIELQKRNASLDMFFGFGVGTLRKDRPDPVSYKESYGAEVRAFATLLEKYPTIETGFSIDTKENTLSPGAFELNTDLYRDGRIEEAAIPLSQKRFWVQKYILEALLDASVSGVEIAPLEELEENKIAVLKEGKAGDGNTINEKYKEGLYAKKYQIEKITKITVDNGLRYDKQKYFRLFKVTVDCEMQISVVPKVLNRILSIKNMIVKVRDVQIVSNLGEKKSESNDALMDRYKEPAVKVSMVLYGLDYLNEKERKHVASKTGGR